MMILLSVETITGIIIWNDCVKDLSEFELKMKIIFVFISVFGLAGMYLKIIKFDSDYSICKFETKVKNI